MTHDPNHSDAAGRANGPQIIESLGLTRSLARRYARLDEIETIWRPPPAPTPDPRIKPKGATATPHEASQVPVVLTWEKFARLALPTAERILLRVPEYGPFIALTTAVHADAPPLLKWDRPERRNPVGWFVYPRGSQASLWGLSPGWCEVPAVALLPNLWGPTPSPEDSEGVVLILEGAKNTHPVIGWLFPHHLRPELAFEGGWFAAHTQSQELQGREQASACGYDFRKVTSRREVTVKVLAHHTWTFYLIDRWD